MDMKKLIEICTIKKHLCGFYHAVIIANGES
jgi:hypothetical protein